MPHKKKSVYSFFADVGEHLVPDRWRVIPAARAQEHSPTSKRHHESKRILNFLANIGQRLLLERTDDPASPSPETHRPHTRIPDEQTNVAPNSRRSDENPIQSEFPQVAPSHITGSIGLNAFNYHRPQDWVVNASTSDYGWDLHIDLPEHRFLKGPSFFAQLKASENPNYISNGEFASVPLEVSTVNFLLEKPQPSMLAICDTSVPAEPVYWMWINDAIPEIERDNPHWRKQTSISFRVPTQSKLSRNSGPVIAQRVRGALDDLEVNAAVSDMVLGRRSRSLMGNPAASRQPGNEIILERATSLLKSVGIIDVFQDELGVHTETLGNADRETFFKLKDIESKLQGFYDHDARRMLDQLETASTEASDGIRAKYFNCLGILALHSGQHAEALSYFSQAAEIRPDEPRYFCNKLSVQFFLSSAPADDSFGGSEAVPSPTLPDGWIDDLRSLLQIHPEFLPAMKLRALWLADHEGADAADRYFRACPAWTREPKQSRMLLADMYKGAGDNVRALELITDAERQGVPLDAWDLSLKGLIHLRLALHDDSRGDSQFITYGFGPTFLDHEQLRKAYASYAKALHTYAERGFPLLSQSAIVNFSTISGMLCRPAEAERFCRQFLTYHPENESVLASLASLLVQQDRSPEAAFYLALLHKSHPVSTTYFKNLLLALLLAEEYEEIVERVRSRGGSAFTNKDEEGLSRMLAAIAFAEIGDQVEAQSEIEALRNDEDLAPRAPIADAEVIRRAFGDRERASQVYRDALERYPDDLYILTQFACHLGNPTIDTAAEIIQIIGRISQLRQLAPEEYLCLIKAHLLLNQAELANVQLNSALTRYPDYKPFLFAQSSILLALGDEDAAYAKVREYLKTEKSYAALLEAAILAKDTGRLPEAIHLFELARDRVRDQDEASRIHAQLYVLKKAQGSPPKEVLRHAIKFGENTSGNPKREAQFFFMVLMTPEGLDRDDPEVREWLQNVRQRVERFSSEYPHSRAFRVFKFTEGISFAQQMSQIVSEVIALRLPYELSTTAFRLSARNITWPMALRAQCFLESQSIFGLWDVCMSSEEFAYGIHIWTNENHLDSETAICQDSDIVCTDISALMTLGELDLLQLFSQSFRVILIARSTKYYLEEEINNPLGSHPLAMKIEQWRLGNLSKIRIRNARPPKVPLLPIDSGNSEVIVDQTDHRSLDELMGFGIGETILLARKTGRPLYSDEGGLRPLVSREYEVPAFGTVALLKRAKIEGIITFARSTELYSQMIRKNFRTVPFTARHLTELTRDIARESPARVSTEELSSHPVLGVFLRQFGDTSVNETSLHIIAIEWWISVLFDRDIPLLYLVECMEIPTFRLAIWRFFSGVLGKVPEESEQRAALLFASFLWGCYRRDEGATHSAWLAIRQTCPRVFSDQTRQQEILFKFIPRSLLRLAKREPGLSEIQRLSSFALLPHNFPQGDPDRYRLENEFRDLAPQLLSG